MDCLKRKEISCRFEFVPHGSVLDPQDGKLALDVGNRLVPGVLDHHQPGHEKECATSLALLCPEYVTEHLKDVPPEKATIVVHDFPDFDAVSAAFLAYRLIVDGEFPPYADRIADYARDVDMGMCFHEPGVIDTPYGVFTGICEIVGRRAKEWGWTQERASLARIQCGFALWEHVLSRMAPGKDPRDGGFFDGEHPFEEALSLILGDRKLYLEDLRKSKRLRIELPMARRPEDTQENNGEMPGESEKETVDGLLVKDPQSLLFRVWARSDSENSPSGRGFVFLAVNYGNERYVISVDPLAGMYLKGLGDMLENAETEKREALGMPRQGPNRPGYNSPDPWYDGRNPLHNYTIVDTPRGGTVLDWGEIKDILASYGKTEGGPGAFAGNRGEMVGKAPNGCHRR